MLAARSADRLEALARGINSTGRGGALAVPTDVTKPEQVRRLLAELAREGGVVLAKISQLRLGMGVPARLPGRAGAPSWAA